MSMKRPKMLKVRQTIELVPTAPFNFDATLHKPDHFPAADTKWESGTRWQTMLWQGKPLGLKLENRGTVTQPRIALSIWSAKPLSHRWYHLVFSRCHQFNETRSAVAQCALDGRSEFVWRLTTTTASL